MIKLSVSKISRMLGVTRKDVQKQINNGKLQTHEGYVTIDSVRLAYPNFNICSEQDDHIKKILKIKTNAEKRSIESSIVRSKNEQKLLDHINKLNNKIKELEKELSTYKHS